MVNKKCVNDQCGNTFTCNNECVDAEIYLKSALRENSCYCPECAKKIDYLEELERVCPRFRQSRVKVNFT
jgi:hypothetical protein